LERKNYSRKMAATTLTSPWCRLGTCSPLWRVCKAKTVTAEALGNARNNKISTLLKSELKLTQNAKLNIKVLYYKSKADMFMSGFL
jgi:hypothetical protein